MASVSADVAPIELPKIPAPIKDFIPYYFNHPKTPVAEILQPYLDFEAELRKVYAQQPHHEAIRDGFTNIVPIFDGHEAGLKVRARDLASESPEDKEKYIMPLSDHERKPDGSPAIVKSLKDFQHNFNIFSESSLSDLDWRNVAAAGSAVTTALLPVPETWTGSKRALREYYHEHLAPASDVDLFIYGLNEEQAIEKMKQIETKIKDSILHETTTIRTKNAITIASQHPTRHVQVVLRLYDSISQIITGFDVDCACAAYDGKQVYASPRALIAFTTQVNTIDLSRRSPSYENRLSKYSHRGFEVHWPLLDRSRVDPTIFERSFNRTMGLARLLVLEKLPRTVDREAYNDTRRKERGRPDANRSTRSQHRLWGNIKDQEEDDVAEWVVADEVSNYHTMVVPYGKRFNASKINKLLYTKDLLLNAEWNKPKDRKVHLHRHPCFFGDVKDVIEDCCGFCPAPANEEELVVTEEESKLYISGKLEFIVDDPGRQEIGSFNPITTDDWTEMAFVGNTQMLCQAIADGDVDYVKSWCSQAGNDINTRDYVGRTPLHLAISCSTLEVVQCLIDNGARMVARLVDGRTALHLAAAAGKVDMVRALMQKSLANEEEEDERQERLHAVEQAKKQADRMPGDKAARKSDSDSVSSENQDFDNDSEDLGSDTVQDSVTMGSFVKVKPGESSSNDIPEDNYDDPDIFNVDVLAWDFQTSPLHLAIINGHIDMIRLLVEEYAADVLLPVKHLERNFSPRSAILTLVLALSLPKDKAEQVVKVLLDLGASSGQADMNEFTALHYMISENNSEILDILFEKDGPAAHSVLNYVMTSGETAMTVALNKPYPSMVTKLLSLGAKSTISFEDFIKVQIARNDQAKNWSPDQSQIEYRRNCTQPLILAAQKEVPRTIIELIANGADPSMLEKSAWNIVNNPVHNTWQTGFSLLDIVRNKIATLKAYDGESFYYVAPETLKDESEYVTGLEPGTYQHFRAFKSFRTQKMRNKRDQQQYNKQWEKVHGKRSGYEEKQAAIAQLIKEFEQVEAELVMGGAKTFQELYPGISQPPRGPIAQGRYKPTIPPPFTTAITFFVADLNDQKKAGYVRLFEAAWNNDLVQVKTLTLRPWKSPDGVEHQPLSVATRDNDGFSPFSIAVLRGHYSLAKAVVEIARAQYEPTEDLPGRRERWAIRESEDDASDSDSESVGQHIFSTIVDDIFTIENVTEISSIVKSHVSPLTMIEWECAAAWFTSTPDFKYRKHTIQNPTRLLSYAIEVDDMVLLKFLLNVGAEQQAHDYIEGENLQSYGVGIDIFEVAIRYQRTAMLAELIKATGAGIPLDELAEKSGVFFREKPRYYQGLSIAGKKNLLWAKGGRDRYRSTVIISNKQPPLLRAAHSGSLDTVQWFLSDVPLKKYQEFAAANKENKKVRSLEQSKAGFETTISSWLNSRSELALHCAILWNPKDQAEEYEALVKYLLRVMPDSLEHKSQEGWTPLQVAATLCRPDIAKLLVDAGANPRARDVCNRNVIHQMIAPTSQQNVIPIGKRGFRDPKQIRKLLALFDKQEVRAMLLERCTIGPDLTGLTPLSYWMAKNENKPAYGKADIIEILTQYSHGEDMEIINGSGDLPLHKAVKQGLPAITSYLISVRPSLLHRENATGRTPLEVASDMYLHERVIKSPTIGVNYSYGRYHRFHASDGDNNAILSHKWPGEFLPVTEINDEKQSCKRTYDICVAAAERYPGKRKLVSLFETNEVAKRVAASDRWPDWRRHEKTGDGEDRDEVTTWMADLGF